MKTLRASIVFLCYNVQLLGHSRFIFVKWHAGFCQQKMWLTETILWKTVVFAKNWDARFYHLSDDKPQPSYCNFPMIVWFLVHTQYFSQETFTKSVRLGEFVSIKWKKSLPFWFQLSSVYVFSYFRLSIKWEIFDILIQLLSAHVCTYFVIFHSVCKTNRRCRSPGYNEVAHPTVASASPKISDLCDWWCQELQTQSAGSGNIQQRTY